MNTLWIAIAIISVIALFSGMILGFAAQRFAVQSDPIVEQVDALLPQSQCGQCGYPGCRPYAQAVCDAGEKINKCAPGGEQVMLKLADLLVVEPQPLEGSAAIASPIRQVALIDENNCIGCTKCIQACPVDAIIGSTRAMHTVINDLCTGCNLCVAPCPTDCISLQPATPTPATWLWDLNTIPVRTIKTPVRDTVYIAPNLNAHQQMTLFREADQHV